MIHKSKGFTLIELVITFLIVVIVYGILANFVGFSTKFYKDESSEVINQEALRVLSVSFEKDVRKLVERADFINISESGSIRTFTLGDQSTANIIVYNYNIIEKKVYKVANSFSSLIASGIEDMNIIKDTTEHPFIIFVAESIPDGRGNENNQVSIKIYLRVLIESSLGG